MIGRPIRPSRPPLRPADPLLNASPATAHTVGRASAMSYEERGQVSDEARRAGTLGVRRRKDSPRRWVRCGQEPWESTDELRVIPPTNELVVRGNVPAETRRIMATLRG